MWGRNLIVFGVLLTGLTVVAPGQEESEPSAGELEVTVVETPSPAPAVPVPTTQSREASPDPPLDSEGLEGTSIEIPEVATLIATRTPQFEYPSADIESASEIREWQRFTVLDTLRQVPGVTVDQQGGLGTVSGLRIRGMESDQNLILLNGRRLPPGLAGQYQLEFFEVSTLESVQVLRGAASSLYGSEAIGGVVDLRSTDARYVETNGISWHAEGGSFETARTGGTLSLRDGIFGAVIDASAVESEGSRPKEDFENGVIRGNFAADLGDGVWFDVLGMVQSGEVGVPGSSFPGTFTFPSYPAGQRNINDSLLVSPRLTAEGDRWDFSLFYSYNQNELQNVDSPVFFGSNNDNLLKQVGRETEAVFNYSPVDETTLTLGAGRYQYAFEQSPIGNTSGSRAATRDFSYNSLFGQVDLALPLDFNLAASLRGDDHDTYDDATTYSLALEKDFSRTGTTLFARRSTGYRPPTGQDLLFIIESPSSNSPPLSEVEPEESESWEVGVRQSLGREGNGSVTLTYFENSYRNGIELDPAFFTFSQIDAEMGGFELALDLSISDRTKVYGNYTYLDTEVVGSSAGNLAGTPGDRLARRPRHTLNGGFLLRGDQWNLGAEIHAVVDRRDTVAGNDPIDPLGLEDYTVTRLFGRYDLSERLQLHGRIENLFDERFEYSRGFEAPGFGAYGGIRLTFGE